MGRAIFMLNDIGSQTSSPLQIMAHVQGDNDRSSNSCTMTHRRQRPRGRQRHNRISIFQLYSLVTLCLLLSAQGFAQVSGQQAAISTPPPPPQSTTVKDNVPSSPTWRRMGGGLSQTVPNNEQELINKILRDDTSSAQSSFQYSLPPPPTPAATQSLATLSTTLVTDSGAVRLPVHVTPPAAAATPSSSSSSSGGKINQSRNKEEQEAFSRQRPSRQINDSGRINHGHRQVLNSRRPRRRRQRRAINVVVNTFSEHKISQSFNSNFLLKSIVTEIGDCLKPLANKFKCRNSSGPGLSASDIPQLMASSSSAGSASPFANVHVLNLSSSGVQTLPDGTLNAIVAKLPNIGFIDLSINQLKSANLAFSGRLTFLNFSQNQLTRFQLQSDNATLAYLDLSHNNLTGGGGSSIADDKVDAIVHIDNSVCANLKMLDLSHNQLIDLAFLRHQIKASGNDTAVQPSPCSYKVLNFAYNRLNSIKRESFANTPHLEILSLGHNLIAEIENDTFAHLQSLQYLDLSDNRLNASSIRALQGIPDLIGLSLARNPLLGDALQGFVASWSLKELDIRDTGLCEIPAALAQSVRTLNLAHNHFQVIRCGDLDSYPLLYNLDLGHCNITEIEDDALGRLEMLATLSLNHNSLRQVPISLPANLIALHLEDNSIMELQANRFAHLVNLKVLSLSGNKIQYLPALPLRKLLVLNLVSAELHGLSQLVVQTSPHLKDLRLDNNPVKCADLLGIAEWATPCRDVGFGAAVTTASDYSDLDDDDLRELHEEDEKNNLKYLLDYVASKAVGERPRQLSTSLDKRHFCRTPKTPTSLPITEGVYLNASDALSSAIPFKVATLVRNKSQPPPDTTTEVERDTNVGETEQISSNLPNPSFRQTVTTITPPPPLRIIKTLPRQRTSLPPPTLSSSPASSAKADEAPVASAAKNNGKPGEILPMRQNNGSLQITGHLNSNKRNGRGDATTNVNEDEKEAANSATANEIFAKANTPEPTDGSSGGIGKSNSSPLSAHLSGRNEAVTAVSFAEAAPNGKEATGKSSESVAIKLAYNKNANIAMDDAADVVVVANVSNNDNAKDKKQANRVYNKKLIKLTDSSNKRKLMPFTAETDLQSLQQKSPISAVMTSTTPRPVLDNVRQYSPTTPTFLSSTQITNEVRNGTTLALKLTTTSTPTPSRHVTSSILDIRSSTRLPTTTRTKGTATEIKMSAPVMTTTEKSLPILSNQIISTTNKIQRQRQSATTRDDVHNLLLPRDENSSSAQQRKVESSRSSSKAVNDSVEMRKKLPKTFAHENVSTGDILATTATTTTTAAAAFASSAKPNTLLRNDDGDSGDKQVANDEIMRKQDQLEAAAAQSSLTKGLIEETSSDDNPLLKLWLQVSTHLSSQNKTILTPRSPEANSDPSPQQPPLLSTTSYGDDVNEGKNLITTKSDDDDNKNATTTRSSAGEVMAGTLSLKSETILINDRNNDDKDKGDGSGVTSDNSAGGEDKNLEAPSRTQESVLKLTAHQQTKTKEQPTENSKIYVAENSLSVAELVIPSPPPHPSVARQSDNHQNANNNNGDTNRELPHHLDKLSQLNTNAIHVAFHGGADDEEIEEKALNGAGGGEMWGSGGRRRPWNEQIKGDGLGDGGGGGGGSDDGSEDNVDNYHHRQPHPGLFIVIGATIGIVLSIGLFRCKRSWSQRRLHCPDLPDDGLMCGSGDINQTCSDNHYHQHQYAHHHPHTMNRFDDYDDDNNYQRSSEADPDQQQPQEGGIGEAFESLTSDNFSPRHQFNENDDYYRCTNWRSRRVVGCTSKDSSGSNKCEAHFVDVQLTPKSERKSVKFDLLPMKILSPNDQPFYPIMTSDCDYASENNNNSSSSNSGCDMGTTDRGNKSSPLDLW